MTENLIERAPQSGSSKIMTPEQAAWFSDVFNRLVAGVDHVLLGKTFVIKLAFTALFASPLSANAEGNDFGVSVVDKN